MSVENYKKSVYAAATREINEREMRKIRSSSYEHNCRHEDELIKLIKEIPNWGTYLTKKQYVITKLFISYRNTSAIDLQLKLTNGVSWHTLFGTTKAGSKKVEGGVLKKLRYVKQILNKIKKQKNTTKK
ncbi:MAG: hypothetical protein ACOCP8_01725 [archaeon]